jgi:hypothetical protein
MEKASRMSRAGWTWRVCASSECGNHRTLSKQAQIVASLVSNIDSIWLSWQRSMHHLLDCFAQK